MGVVGRFDAINFETYPRDARVICRTSRGLELGAVVCPINEFPTENSNMDGQILRQVGSEDDLILERLERHRDKAFRACQQLISQRRLPAILVDVEHLFDGESVYFYFLGEVDSELEKLTEELAVAYESKVRFKKFAETLANGCGPDCGTGDNGCASGNCGTCALSGSCSSKN